MTVHEAARRIAENASRVYANDVRAINGLRAAQRGMVRVPLPDGRHVNDKGGPAVIPRPDEAARALAQYLKDMHEVDIRLARMAVTGEEFARLDLEPYRDDEGGIIAQHEGRWASPDERKVAQAESLDDDERQWCRSCKRIPGNDRGALADGLCSDCGADLRRCKGLLVEQGDQKRADKLTLPPLLLVQMRADGRVPRSDSYKTAVAPGAEKRRARKTAAAT